MIIAVDFDGTISVGMFPNIRGQQPGAKEALEKMRERGHYVIIWTCRTGDNLLNAINWLLEKEIPFDRVNSPSPENVSLWGDGGRKIFADVYIDDQNLGGFPGWKEAVSILETTENW